MYLQKGEASMTPTPERTLELARTVIANAGLRTNMPGVHGLALAYIDSQEQVAASTDIADKRLLAIEALETQCEQAQVQLNLLSELLETKNTEEGEVARKALRKAFDFIDCEEHTLCCKELYLERPDVRDCECGPCTFFRKHFKPSIVSTHCPKCDEHVDYYASGSPFCGGCGQGWDPNERAVPPDVMAAVEDIKQLAAQIEKDQATL